MDKKKILFFNNDRESGVNYYRIKTPAIELEKIDNSENFRCEISHNLNFEKEETIEYLKSFDIIHFHRFLVLNYNLTVPILNEIKNSGTKLIMDIDDYWRLDKNHPQYEQSKSANFENTILLNLKMVDYVTTTTDVFADEIKKVTQKENVFVFENSINPEWMTQFQDGRKKDPNGLVRITYVGGSSHLDDLRQLEGVFNVLSSDPRTKNKFKIILMGWDSRGYKYSYNFNEKLKNELNNLGLWNRNIIEEINKAKGNIFKVKSIPSDLKNKYANNMFIREKKDIETKESVYCDYEKILTDNYRLIKDKNYYDWLMNFEIRGRYPNEDFYGRRWTEPPNTYANVLNETDIVLAPLKDKEFNKFKSNLKQVECWTRKIPVVCSDVLPYNFYGEHMRNCILIPNKKNAKKYWIKELRKLILDKNLRDDLGNNLYSDFKDKFHLTNVTKKRKNFYLDILK